MTRTSNSARFGEPRILVSGFANPETRKIQTNIIRALLGLWRNAPLSLMGLMCPFELSTPVVQQSAEYAHSDVRADFLLTDSAQCLNAHARA